MEPLVAEEVPAVAAVTALVCWKVVPLNLIPVLAVYVVPTGAAQVPSARRKFVVPPPSLTKPARSVDALCA